MDVVMVPVPISRLQEVYKVLADDQEGGRQQTMRTADNRTDEADGGLDRLLAAALPAERQFLSVLAAARGKALRITQISEQLGGDDPEPFVAGVVGPLTKRSRQLG